MSGAITGNDLGVISTAWGFQAAADFNGDGKADILWRNTNGEVGLSVSNPDTSFTFQDFRNVTTDWSIQRAADFNGDGQADILWRNNNGDVVLWSSNPGPVTFTAHDLGIVGPDWHL